MSHNWPCTQQWTTVFVIPIDAHARVCIAPDVRHATALLRVARVCAAAMATAGTRAAEVACASLVAAISPAVLTRVLHEGWHLHAGRSGTVFWSAAVLVRIHQPVRLGRQSVSDPCNCLRVTRRASSVGLTPPIVVVIRIAVERKAGARNIPIYICARTRLVASF